MNSPLMDARVVLGVTGSIASYKAADLASKLMQEGARVDVVLTRGAANFVTPLTFRTGPWSPSCSMPNPSRP